MKNKVSILAWIALAVPVFLFVYVLYLSVAGNFNTHTAIMTVTDKERVNKDDTSYYLVFGKDPDGQTVVYKNTDNILRGKWNSSEMQGELEVGSTYQVNLVGYRVPLLSWYENILKAEEVEVKESEEQ